ncbi:ACT domain-containing protein [Ruminococcaceae bacterium OttesenSCG-928-A11]|nr:ACT domain-containing protein [Ruminococcaceae bacterium OttesenSCG-928-A11]
MQAVITVVGTDKVGILAKVSTICAEHRVNIEEVTQSILRGTFAMIMLCTLPEDGVAFSVLAERLRTGGEELGVDVKITRQDIYDVMHNV